MKSKDFKEALACYNKSIELNDKDATTFSNRSLAYINLKCEFTIINYGYLI